MMHVEKLKQRLFLAAMGYGGAMHRRGNRLGFWQARGTPQNETASDLEESDKLREEFSHLSLAVLNEAYNTGFDQGRASVPFKAPEPPKAPECAKRITAEVLQAVVRYGNTRSDLTANAVNARHGLSDAALAQHNDAVNGAYQSVSNRLQHLLDSLTVKDFKRPKLPQPDSSFNPVIPGLGFKFHSEDQIVGYANECVAAALAAQKVKKPQVKHVKANAVLYWTVVAGGELRKLTTPEEVDSYARRGYSVNPIYSEVWTEVKP